MIAFNLFVAGMFPIDNMRAFIHMWRFCCEAVGGKPSVFSQSFLHTAAFFHAETVIYFSTL